MGAFVQSLMGDFDGLMEDMVISLRGIIVSSMAGNLMLEHDSKWLEGLIFGAAGWLGDAESRVKERRWGQQR